MKKFLTTIIVIIVAVSIGFGVFYLVKDNEVISLKTASLYKNINEKFELGLDLEDPNSYTTVEVFSTNDSVVKVTNGDIKIKGKTAVGEFEAVGGGVAKVVFKTNNAKFRNVSCDIIVCDGTASYPFRISSAEELASIGTNPLYTLDKCYELSNSIDLGTIIDIQNGGSWTPLPELKGTFNGNGHTIENLYVNGGENIGLFSSLASTATVKNVKFENAVITANENTLNMGTVAGINEGTISRVEVKNVGIYNGVKAMANVGGIAGANRSVNTGEQKSVAIIDRASAVVTMAGAKDGKSGIKGVVGGIAGANTGAKIMFSYTTGTANTDDSAIFAFGGIVGENKYLENTGSGSYKLDLGGYVQECYSIVVPTKAQANKVGFVIGTTTDSTSADGTFYNVITGNYYEANLTGVSGIAKVAGNKDADFNLYSTRVSNETENLKDLSTLISASIGKINYSFSSGSLTYTKEDPELYYWNTSVWEIKVGENNGYPVLNYSDQAVSPAENQSIVQNVVRNYNDFKTLLDANLDATMLVVGDVDFTGVNWTPVGTEEKPFNGQIYVSSGVQFKNLKVAGSNKYAGLFGYVGSSAIIDGLYITDSEINGEYAGVIAGYNNGQISNFMINNSTVNANVYGGAVAGYNTGRIYGYSETLSQVSTKGGVTNVTINGLLRKLELGGIAGHNAGTIEGKQRITLNNVKINTLSDFNSAYVGGVAGYNEGTITGVTAGVADGAVVINNEKTGTINAGGVAGYTCGSISSASVVANITVGNSEGSYVGGVAGVVFFATQDKQIIYCDVKNSTLHGYKAGGIAGSANVGYSCQLNATNNIWVILAADTARVDTSENVIIINVCSVDDVKLNGTYTAGVVCELSKGVVSDIYSNVKMIGSNNAGIVYHVGYNANSKEGGVVNNVVSIAENAKGKGYGASANDVHRQPLLSKRNCGFVKNYHYLKSSKLKDNNQCGFGGNESLIESEMKKSNNWKFLNTSIWNVSDGSIPTIKVNLFN